MEPQVMITVALLLGLCCPVPAQIWAIFTTAPPAPAGCDYKGGHYPSGKWFKPSPCESCACDDEGLSHCHVISCRIPTRCCDAIYDPTQCCPICPNGFNCCHGDSILPLGAVIKLDRPVDIPNYRCQCLGPRIMCGTNFDSWLG